MISRAILNMETGHFEGPSGTWIKKIRASENLKAINLMKNDELETAAKEIMSHLIRWIGLEAGKNEIGQSFVRIGKEWFNRGIPVSELAFSINLARKSVIEYLLQETELSDASVMYSLVDVMNRIAEFFQLGTYYLVKGFLEEVYISMNRKDEVSEGILKKYFKDEFFFKG